MRQSTVEPAYIDPEFSDLSRREATDRLLTLALAASPADRPGYEDRVVRLNMTIARDVARRYRGRGIPSDDLDQVALLGLVKAVKGFKADRGERPNSWTSSDSTAVIRAWSSWMDRGGRTVQPLSRK